MGRGKGQPAGRGGSAARDQFSAIFGNRRGSNKDRSLRGEEAAQATPALPASIRVDERIGHAELTTDEQRLGDSIRNAMLTQILTVYPAGRSQRKGRQSLSLRLTSRTSAREAVEGLSGDTRQLVEIECIHLDGTFRGTYAEGKLRQILADITSSEEEAWFALPDVTGLGNSCYWGRRGEMLYVAPSVEKMERGVTVMGPDDVQDTLRGLERMDEIIREFAGHY